MARSLFTATADAFAPAFWAVFVGTFCAAEKTGIIAMLEIIFRRTADKCQNRCQPCQPGVNLGVFGALPGSGFAPRFGPTFTLYFGPGFGPAFGPDCCPDMSTRHGFDKTWLPDTIRTTGYAAARHITVAANLHFDTHVNSCNVTGYRVVAKRPHLPGRDRLSATWVDFMVLSKFFETRKRMERDANELSSLRIDYGSNMKAVLWQRANDDTLRDRDRQHWQRLLKKAERLSA